MENNTLLKGIGASPGIVIGKALIVDHGKPDFTHYRLTGEKEIKDEEMKEVKPTTDESKTIIGTDKPVETTEAKAEFTKMKLAHKISPLENPIQIRDLRKTIARLNTELTNKQ